MSAQRRTKPVGKGRPQVPADVRDRADGDAALRGHGAKSPQRREAAILALLHEPTLQQAALACGVNERTLRRWLTEDEGFRALLRAARNAVFEAGISRIQMLSERAVDVFAECVKSGKMPIRLQAASKVWDVSTYHRESEAIIEKLATIEAQLEAQQQREPNGRR